MARVTGIGGFFFVAADGAALAEWYETHLGIPRSPRSYDEAPWSQAAGPTVFEPFTDTGDALPGGKRWMLNLRVDDLDGLVAQLTGAGIEVELDGETYPNGRFASLTDPEGNPIQLWQPAG